ncbi:MAG TPA: flagellar brake protein [Gammaproteobacteria bacterium]
MSSPEDAAGGAGTAVALPDCGQRISVETPRHTEKLWTHMIGFKPGAYLVLEKPAGADSPDGKRTLKDGDSLVIRFMKDGSIFGFRTPVLGSASLPYKLLFVAYPVEVAQHSLRSSPRVQCSLPCDGCVGDRPFVRAFIRDLSATGCQLRIPLDALLEAEELEPAPAAEGGDTEADTAAEGTAEGGDAADGEAADGDAGGEQEAAAQGTANGERSAAQRLLLNMALPGDETMFTAEGEVLEWQQLPRYHLLRVKFDTPQTELFELLSVYLT